MQKGDLCKPKDDGWNYKEIRSRCRRMTFGRGWRSWLLLVVICFLFSFLGGGSNTAFLQVTSLDRLLGLIPENPNGNVELLKAYVLQEEFWEKIPLLSEEVVQELIDFLSGDLTWLINLLAANGAYFVRNAGEVFVSLLLSALLITLLRFLVQFVFIVGRHRYVMERRVYNDPKLRRAVAPFHRRYWMNILRCMLGYELLMFAWMFTIVGGFYKIYQYRMVPYLLAENPSIRLREALRLSAEMTKGKKRKMFWLDLSMWYVTLAKLIPVVGILIALPLETVKDAEIYFILRNGMDEEQEPFFCEPAFSLPACTERTARRAAVYFALPDLVLDEERGQKPLPYRLTDYLLLFFLFCMIGWVWEEVLHWAQTRQIVNRGTMYGPWLPIYGFGGVLCIFCLSRYKKNLPKTFALIIILTGTLEFITSWVLEFFFNAIYWEYHGMFANLNGRVCLSGLLAFGLGGSVAIYLAGPYFRRKFELLSKRTRWVLCAVLVALFAVDALCCLLFGFNSGEGVGEALPAIDG